MSIRSKLENIWYHYGSVIIVVLVLLGVLLVSLHSCVTKPKFDIQVYYVAESNLYTEQLDWVESAVKAHCKDVNGDGEITVAITGVRVGSSADKELLNQYMTGVQTGDIVLFFGDLGGIEYLHERKFLQPLTDFVGEKDYAWAINETGLSAEIDGFDKAFGEVPLYAALRKSEKTWSNDTSAGRRNYDASCATLRSMIAVEKESPES